ncbi:MAG: hypothetical protein OEY14_17425, partial [Myxococcales bacterium]|nr:hypothetical protein [Myxococcales bacterium]
LLKHLQTQLRLRLALASGDAERAAKEACVAQERLERLAEGLPEGPREAFFTKGILISDLMKLIRKGRGFDGT